MISKRRLLAFQKCGSGGKNFFLKGHDHVKIKNEDRTRSTL